MKSLKFLSGLVLMVFLAGCASTVHVERDESVDFSKYDTYAWLEKDDKKGLVERNVRAAVNQELSKAGWNQSNSRPDVLISYDVLVEKNLKENSTPVYSQSYTRSYYNPYTRRWRTIYYPSQFLGYDRDAVEVREGTLTLTVIDARTDKTIWQGWTTEEVNSRNLTSKEIQQSVKSIFRKFDIAKN
jgi:hypothetical protein